MGISAPTVTKPMCSLEAVKAGKVGWVTRQVRSSGPSAGLWGMHGRRLKGISSWGVNLRAVRAERVAGSWWDAWHTGVVGSICRKDVLQDPASATGTSPLPTVGLLMGCLPSSSHIPGPDTLAARALQLSQQGCRTWHGRSQLTLRPPQIIPINLTPCHASRKDSVLAGGGVDWPLCRSPQSSPKHLSS